MNIEKDNFLLLEWPVNGQKNSLKYKNKSHCFFGKKKQESLLTP